MPREQVAQLGTGQALMHLSSDAVRAAVTSPFLEASAHLHGLPVAILCSLTLPVNLAQRASYSLTQMWQSSSGLTHRSLSSICEAFISFLHTCSLRLIPLDRLMQQGPDHQTFMHRVAEPCDGVQDAPERPGQTKGDPVRLAMQAAAGAVAATIPCPLIMLCAVRGEPPQVCPR